jgi:RNA polymerase sigma-70 factor (TIGR02952 family)
MVGPRPLDAGRHSADGAAGAGLVRPRPTPRPRLSSDGTGATAVVPSDGHVTGPPDNGNVAREPVVLTELPDAGVPVAEPPVPDDGPDVWDLVRRAQEGDAEAFGEIYDHYVGMVHRYVYHRVGDRTTAEDVTSETFVRALRRIDSLSFQGRDVGAWLITIARNIVFDHVKSSRYRLEVTTADMRDADTFTDGPEDAVVQQLTNEALVECMRKLGPEQQECLALRFLHGLSVAETAQVMGKRDGAIKALQHRAVRRLAGLLPEGLR